MSVHEYRHPDLIEASAKIAADTARFLASGKTIEYLPPYGHTGGNDPKLATYNGRNADGTDNRPRVDMALYYTQTEIVSRRGRPGILPMGMDKWRAMIRAGEVHNAHVHISGSVPLWRRDYIDALAAEIAARRGKE